MKNPGIKLASFALMVSLSSLMNATDVLANEGKQGKVRQKDAVLSTEMKSNGHKWVKARIKIQASPHVVWETVHEERKRDPELEYSKVLSHDPATNHLVLEQKFSVVPVVGSAVCVMTNREVPLERIDYNMVSSDKFKAFEGSWVLTPGSHPNESYLELSSYCDIGLPVPRMLVEGATGKKLQRRLANVRDMAEATQTRLAKK